MPRSRISDEEVEENAELLYRHRSFLPDSAINKSPDEIREMFDKGLLIENSDGDIEEISILTQALTENEINSIAEIKKEKESHVWYSLTDEEKMDSDPERYKQELIIFSQENPQEVKDSEKELN